MASWFPKAAFCRGSRLSFFALMLFIASLIGAFPSHAQSSSLQYDGLSLQKTFSRILEASCTERDITALPIFFYVTSISPSFTTFLNVTMTFNPRSPVYVVTSQDGQPDWQILHDMQSNGVQIRYIEHYAFRGSDAWQFRQVYLHRAVNPEWYECMCFERFFVVRDIALLEGIQRLAYSDADIALFGDIHKGPFYESQAGYVSITQWSTYFGVWKTDALEKFCEHMLWFYKRSAADIDKDIGMFGNLVKPPVVDPADPEKYVWQFSDMFMLSSFLKRSGLNYHLLLDDTEAYPEIKALENAQRLRPEGDDSNVCESPERFDLYLDWRKDQVGRMAPYQNGILLVGIHFQGMCKEKVVPHVFRKLFPEAGGIAAVRRQTS